MRSDLPGYCTENWTPPPLRRRVVVDQHRIERQAVLREDRPAVPLATLRRAFVSRRPEIDTR
jgi:hypothetical protein